MQLQDVVSSLGHGIINRDYFLSLLGLSYRYYLQKMSDVVQCWS